MVHKKKDKQQVLFGMEQIFWTIFSQISNNIEREQACMWPPTVIKVFVMDCVYKYPSMQMPNIASEIILPS